MLLEKNLEELWTQAELSGDCALVLLRNCRFADRAAYRVMGRLVRFRASAIPDLCGGNAAI